MILSERKLIISEQNWDDLEILWNFLNMQHSLPAKADAAIIGGEGQLVDTAWRAAQLYHAGVIPLILASGFANPEHNAVKTEAELLSDELIKHDVPPSAVIQEPYATNTAENITHCVKLLQTRGIRSKTIILIHKPYMTRRFYATASAYWPDPQPALFVTGFSMSLREFYEYDKSVYGGEGRMIALMIGDYERTKEYPKRGWMTVQDIPPSTEAAYERLMQSGLTGKPL